MDTSLVTTTGSFTISVNVNTAPTNIRIYAQQEIPNNTAAFSYFIVGGLTATDPDFWDLQSFVLTSSTDYDNTSFNLSGTTCMFYLY